MNKKQRARYDALEKRLDAVARTPLPSADECHDFWQSIFGPDGAAPAGDFSWDDYESSDFIPYRCCDGEDGCSGWDMVAYTTKLSRQGTIEAIAEFSEDRDGNWELEGSYTAPDDMDFDWWLRDRRSNDRYFRAYVEYWLDCAATRRDPLKQFRHPTKQKVVFVDDCLDEAESSLEYLEGDAVWLAGIR